MSDSEPSPVRGQTFHLPLFFPSLLLWRAVASVGVLIGPGTIPYLINFRGDIWRI